MSRENEQIMAVTPNIEEAVADALNAKAEENKASILANIVNMPSKAFAFLTRNAAFAQKHNVAINLIGWAALAGIAGFLITAAVAAPLVAPVLAYFSIQGIISSFAAQSVVGALATGLATGTLATALSTGFTLGKAAISGLKKLFSGPRVPYAHYPRIPLHPEPLTRLSQDVLELALPPSPVEQSEKSGKVFPSPHAAVLPRTSESFDDSVDSDKSVDSEEDDVLSVATSCAQL